MRKILVLVSLLLALVIFQAGLAHAGGRVFFSFGFGAPIHHGVVVQGGFFVPHHVIVVPHPVFVVPRTKIIIDDGFIVKPHRGFVVPPRFGTFADPFSHRLGVVEYWGW